MAGLLPQLLRDLPEAAGGVRVERVRLHPVQAVEDLVDDLRLATVLERHRAWLVEAVTRLTGPGHDA